MNIDIQQNLLFFHLIPILETYLEQKLKYKSFAMYRVEIDCVWWYRVISPF